MPDPVEIDHVVIKVSDWDRSNASYRDVVGAELVEISRGRHAYRLGGTRLNVDGPGSTAQPIPAKPMDVGNSDRPLSSSATNFTEVDYLAGDHGGRRRITGSNQSPGTCGPRNTNGPF